VARISRNVEGGEPRTLNVEAGEPQTLNRPQFENNYFTEMCSGSEAGSYLRLIEVVHHSTLGWRVIKKKKPYP